MFQVEGCEIFNKPFFIEDKCIAMPELWEPIDWNDSDYARYISRYCINYFSENNYPDDVLCVTDINFFNEIKNCQKLTMFYSYPSNILSLSKTRFYQEKIYDNVLKELEFIGYNVICGSGSALIEGIYPIYLSNILNGILCYNHKIGITVNKFGLLDNIKDVEYICRLNSNKIPNEYWHGVGVYFDYYTYNLLMKTLNQSNP